MADDGAADLPERGLLGASDGVWAEAERRAGVIGALAARPEVGGAAVDAAASELGLSRRAVYRLLRRWRAGSGLVSDMIPNRSPGGRGQGRLGVEVEKVIADAIGSEYLTRQKRSRAAVLREVARLCAARGLLTPSRSAVERRIAGLDPMVAVRKREGVDAARALKAAGGDPPVVSGPLERVQIDHTVVDVIVVDEVYRRPIGRPYVTFGIDVFSRAIPGVALTLEAPSALSVGLCLANMVTDKGPWLDRLGVAAVWPMSGKPRVLFLDNASEFHGEALSRGASEHGIEVDYRPVGSPHFGGVVERVIGTMMGRVHELPGTTFSSPAERGSYDSDGRAVLTLAELERWLALAICVYHGQVHSGLGQTPGGLWAAGVAEHGRPAVVANETAFLVDFLPVIRRSISRTGFVIDHVRYYSDALKPWIADRDRLGRFVIRRDPRDISRVWVLDPAGQSYVEVGYRTMSHPPVSVWEQRAAVAALREQGRAQVDERSLFAMVTQMRQIADEAARTTRRARRDTARRTPTSRGGVGVRVPEPPADAPDTETVTVFPDIEAW